MGYARGINGTLGQHMRYAARHVWSRPGVQKRVLALLKALIHQREVDICCLLEVDTGSFGSHGMNQLNALMDEEYRYADAQSKYGTESRHHRAPLTAGKSNGFIARRDYPFETLYFTVGTKRLIYRVRLGAGLTLYFTHFSLKRAVRERQLYELFELADGTEGEVILMGDFNVLTGLDEVRPLLATRPLTLLNDPAVHTFVFHRRRLVLDLCIASKSLAARASLEVIPQPYSDHAALLLTL